MPQPQQTDHSPVLAAVADVLKLQIVLTAMSQSSPATAIFILMLATAYEAANMHLRPITQAIWAAIRDAPAEEKVPAVAATAPTREPQAFIQFERSATAPSGRDQKAADPRIEAVLAHISTLPAARSLRFNGQEFIPNFAGVLQIDTDIWFEILRPAKAIADVDAATADSLRYRLSTYEHDITYIHRFIEQTIQTYEQEKKNRLGSETYYFDQITNVTDGRYALPTPNGFCAFKKSKFQSNRSLDNVYFPQMDDLAGRVDFFMNRRDWYDDKGIPHTLGIVMHGHPGCGKTSTIKAIATATRRHIFNISLSHIKTREALKDLFYNDVIHLFNGERLETLTIPIKQRLYVIEDIDAMDSVVIKRSAATEKDREREAKRKRKAKERAEMMRDLGRDDEVVDDELDLATLLNVLDGVRETPGRILILSTNYPERLDEALLRPGRFDIILEFAKHSVEVLRRHMENFYDCELTQEQLDALKAGGVEGKWTPAEVSQILFKHLGNVDGAVVDLITRQPADLFRFSRIGGPAAVVSVFDVATGNTAEYKEVRVEGWGGEPILEDLRAVNDFTMTQNEVSSISTASSEEEINEFLPAMETQKEFWNAVEQRQTTFGLPKRVGYPSGYNADVICTPVPRTAAASPYAIQNKNKNSLFTDLSNVMEFTAVSEENKCNKVFSGNTFLGSPI